MSRKIVTAGVDQVTHCKHGHVYTPENSYVAPGKGPGARICRQCRPERQEARRATPDGRWGEVLELAVRPFEPATWRDRAACVGAEREVFFPTQGEDVRRAKAVCAACPVRADCLDYAMRWDIRYGIWGGLSEKQRRRLRHEVRAS